MDSINDLHQITGVGEWPSLGGFVAFLWKFEILWGLGLGGDGPRRGNCGIEKNQGGVSTELGRTGGLRRSGDFCEVGSSARWMLGVWSCSPEAFVKALRTCRTERVFSWLHCQASLGCVGAPSLPVCFCKAFSWECWLVSLAAHWRVLLSALCLFILRAEASALVSLPPCPRLPLPI